MPDVRNLGVYLGSRPSAPRPAALDVQPDVAKLMHLAVRPLVSRAGEGCSEPAAFCSRWRRCPGTSFRTTPRTPTEASANLRCRPRADPAPSLTYISQQLRAADERAGRLAKTTAVASGPRAARRRRWPSTRKTRDPVAGPEPACRVHEAPETVTSTELPECTGEEIPVLLSEQVEEHAGLVFHCSNRSAKTLARHRRAVVVVAEVHG